MAMNALMWSITKTTSIFHDYSSCSSGPTSTIMMETTSWHHFLWLDDVLSSGITTRVSFMPMTNGGNRGITRIVMLHTPYCKGERASFIVADYFSTDFGWLQDSIGQCDAQATICPGKNQDGYFTCQEVCEQASQACRIVQEVWPDFEHVFIYDNATTHRKRAKGSLSAQQMPKFSLGSHGSPESNFLVETNRWDSSGNLVYNSHGTIVKDKVKIMGASYNGVPQDLYFPTNHPTYAGKFKGMKAILEECGLYQFANLCTECPGFKCADAAANCCCCHILYNQPEFLLVKSLLEETCCGYGVEVLFLP